MMLTRPPKPRKLLKDWLLMAVSDGSNAIHFRRIRHGYGMWWEVDGTQYEGIPPFPGYVRRFASVLWEYANGRIGVLQRAGRFARRLGSVTERGVFDEPIGEEFVVSVSYRADWRWGRVTELEITVGESAALAESGIAKQECDLAMWEYE